MWPLISIALVPFFLNFFALRSTRKIILSSLLMGVPYSFASGEALFRLSGTWWVSDGLMVFPLLHTLEYSAAIALLVLFASTFYVIPGLLVSKIRKPVIPLTIIFALLFALAEFIRSGVFLFGYSWGVLGYLLIDASHVKHIASLVGVYGLTFVIILVNAWVAILITRYTESEGGVMSRIHRMFFEGQHAYETIALILLFILILLFGEYRESQTPNTQLHLRVAVSASDIPTDESINESSYQTYRSLFTLALQKNPDLILTPENVFPYFTVDEEGNALAKHQSAYLPNVRALYEDFLSLSRKYSHTTFAIATHSEKNNLLFNSIVLYRNGEIVSVYHKRRPVPFSEYAPFGLSLPIFERFASGDDVQDFRLGTIPLAGYICSEIDITPLSTHGAKLILSSSNDSVFMGKGISSLHQKIARMRALEAGVYLLRSTKGGISSIIDPYGNTVTVLSEKNGVLIADIP
jgi:apolipoprotein N-acyltransferase